jgi:uncharacterized protein YcfJ
MSCEDGVPALVGDARPGQARNIISGLFIGLSLGGYTGNQVQGNYIGTGADGVVEIANGAWVMVTGGAEYGPDLENNGDLEVTPVGARLYLPLIWRRS